METRRALTLPNGLARAVTAACITVAATKRRAHHSEAAAAAAFAKLSAHRAAPAALAPHSSRRGAFWRWRRYPF
jgi:hypothetical protein